MALQTLLIANFAKNHKKMAIKIKVITKKLFKNMQKNTLTNKKLITPKEKYFNNKNCKK